MESFRKYLLSSVARLPEDGGGAEPPAPAPVAAPSAADPATAPPTSKQPDTLISTISGLRADRRVLENENAELRRRAAEAEALASRLAKSGTEPAAPAPRPVVAPPVSAEDEVDRRANYKLFLRDVESLRERGVGEFGGQFQQTIQALGAVGAADDAIVAQVLAVDRDNAHVILSELSKDLERAVSLVNMDLTSRVAAITRMSIMAQNAKKTAADPKGAPDPAPAAPAASAKPAPKLVSNAPAPAPAISSGTSKTVDWRSDDSSDEEFSRGFDKNLKERVQARMR